MVTSFLHSSLRQFESVVLLLSFMLWCPFFTETYVRVAYLLSVIA